MKMRTLKKFLVVFSFCMLVVGLGKSNAFANEDCKPCYANNCYFVVFDCPDLCGFVGGSLCFDENGDTSDSGCDLHCKPKKTENSYIAKFDCDDGVIETISLRFSACGPTPCAKVKGCITVTQDCKTVFRCHVKGYLGSDTAVGPKTLDNSQSLLQNLKNRFMQSH